MREFTFEERKIAAAAALAQTQTMPMLREMTAEMVAEAWAQGEVSYCVPNQYAIQLQCELTEARQTLAEIGQMNRIDRGVTNAALDILRGPPPRKEIVVFMPDEIEAAMDKNLAAGLRQLADALEAGTIEGKCLDCQGHGFGPKNDQRAHLMLRIDLAAPVIQTFLGGESREEFERDRMGQTGEDNARKLKGGSDVG